MLLFLLKRKLYCGIIMLIKMVVNFVKKKIDALIKKVLSNELVDNYRPLPFWSWNDKLDKNELVEQIKWMKEQGFGGYFMHARSGLITEYLSDDWFECIEACLDAGKEYNMSSWAYDENGWPSGFVGGKLLEDPENCDKYLTYEIGKFDANSFVSYLITENELIRTTEGKNGKYLNLYVHTSISTADVLNPDVVDKFINQTHEEYKKRLGDKFDSLLCGFFTDEPQYHRARHPYTIMIAKHFDEVYSEDILDRLGLLFVEKNGYEDFRYKYWKGMQTLLLNNFSKRVYDWCINNNSALTGHYIEETTLNYQMLCCAGIMPYYEYETIPGIDHLGSNVSGDISARQVYSVAKQTGKKYVLTETYAGCGWDSTPSKFKRIAESQYVCGVNLMCQHLLPYSICGQRKRDYPAFFSWSNPWIREDYKSFNDYFSRLGCLLGESSEKVNVAILSPIRSVYFDYKREEFSKESVYNDSYLALAKKLAKLNVPFDIIDETVLAKHGRVEGNKFIVGNCSYEYILFPKMITMDTSSKVLFEKYYDNGGKLLFTDGYPTYLEGKKHDYSFINNTDFDQVINAQEYRVNNYDTKIKSTIRSIDGYKFIYAVNTSEEEYDITFEGDFKSFICLDIEKGKTCKIGRNLHFNPNQSYVLFLSNECVEVENKKYKEYSPLGEFKLVDFSSNYLTLDKLKYSFDGVNYSDKLVYMGVFYELLKERVDNEVYLKYEFESKFIPERLFLLSENMNNIYCKVNGSTVNFNLKSDFDKKIMKADISKLVKIGNNEIIIKIHFYQSDVVYNVLFGKNVTEGLKNMLAYDTSIESCYLEGDFGVYSKNDLIDDVNQADYLRGDNFYLDKLKSTINDTLRDGFPFFAGCMTLEKEFEWGNDNCLLDLKGNYCLSEIVINGIVVDKSYFKDKIDISDYVINGTNKIVIKLWSGNRNIFGPHHFKLEPLGVGPYTFEHKITDWVNGKCSEETDDYSFKKFGLFNV